MSDKELLELAAKAVGMHVKAHRVDADDNFTHLVVGQKFTQEKIDWNPLTDDGDALRLAVRLGLFDGPKFFHFRSLERFAGQDADDYTANRRAIVRAAAEVGKSMQP